MHAFYNFRMPKYWPVVRAAMCSGLYPNLVRVDYGKKKFKVRFNSAQLQLQLQVGVIVLPPPRALPTHARLPLAKLVVVAEWLLLTQVANEGWVGLGWDGMGWVGLGWGWSKVASRIHHWVRFSVPRLGSTIYLGVVYSLVSFSLYVSQGDGGQPMQVATSRSRD